MIRLEMKDWNIILTIALQITANLWSLTAHIYHVKIIMTSGFSKKYIFINMIFIS